jgi:hypothetical protein
LAILGLNMLNSQPASASGWAMPRCQGAMTH